MHTRVAFAWTSALLVAGALAGACKGADDSKLDKKVLEIVKQVSDLHKNAKSLHVEAALNWSGEQGKFDTEVTYDLEQPNQLAMRSRNKHDKNAGPGFPHLILLSLPAEEDIFQDTIVPAGLLALTIDASAQSRSVLQQRQRHPA